jgi:hypothetical protein
MINVLKYDNLLKIEEFLRENEFDSGNLSVVMYIETQERLNRINKDYYYKVNPNGTDVLDQDVKDVNIQVGNVTFTYRLRENNANN